MASPSRRSPRRPPPWSPSRRRPATPAPVADATAGGEGVILVRSDLDFILKQIKIAEAHAAGTPLQDLIPNIRFAYGLRTVDGSENNLLDTAASIRRTSAPRTRLSRAC